MRSTLPPGVNGTISVIGRDGKSSPRASRLATPQANAACESKRKVRRVIVTWARCIAGPLGWYRFLYSFLAVY
jgi:hypothetical protein